MKSTVLAFGTFDLLHGGHRSFLKQAAKLGATLVVAVSRDRVVRRLKGQHPIHHERQRLARVAALPYVTNAVLASADPSRRFTFIKRIRPSVIALGYDQTHFTNNLHRDLRAHGVNCRVVRLKPHRPQRFKSSLIRKRLAQSKKP